MSYKSSRLATLAAVKEQPNRPGPERVIWQITQACDLCCVPCRSQVFNRPSPTQLSPEESLDLVEQIRRCGQPELQLTGGDPLKRPDIGSLVLYATRIGLQVGLTLSGTPRTTPRLVGLLKAAGLAHMTFCVDGPTVEVHDGFRKVKGSYGWTVAGIRVAQAIGLPIRIETSVTPVTLPYLDELAAMVGRLGTRVWQVTFGGRPERDPGGAFGQDEYSIALEKLAALQGTVNYRVRVTPAPYFGAGRQVLGCGTHWQPFELFVDDDGDVERWNSGHRLGNIRETPFAELVEQALAARTEQLAAPVG